MKKAAVILSGCGVFDGSEIHEAVSALLALDTAGASYQCLAPNIDQTQVINHLTGDKTSEARNTLIEAARIARGDIKDIKSVSAADFDLAIYPGGHGAALNLSDFGTAGENMKMNADVLAFAQAMKDANKPQGFICISPAMISAIYGPEVKHTIGNDAATAAAIEKMGGKHMNCPVTDAIIDKKHKVISTPAYMLAQRISEVYAGVTALVKETIALT